MSTISVTTKASFWQVDLHEFNKTERGRVMANSLQDSGRKGVVLRVLAHGTIIVWDLALSRAYPYYKAGPDTFHLNEDVLFSTDRTDTIIVKLERPESPGRTAIPSWSTK